MLGPAVRSYLFCVTMLARAVTAGFAVGPTIESPFLARHIAPSVAVLEDGSFALGGTRIIPVPPNNPQARFELQAYSSEGIPNGPVVVPEAGLMANFGSIGSLGGRYFVSWQNILAKVTHAARATAGGALGSPSAFPNSDVQNYGQHARYGSAPMWRFLPVTYREGLDFPLATLQAFAPNGRPAGRVVRLAGDEWSVFLDDAAINGQGRFVAVTDQCLGSGPGANCRRRFQVFDVHGTPLTGLLSKGLPLRTDGEFNGIPVVAIDGIGGMLMGWAEGLATDVATLVFQPFDAAGSPVLSRVVVARAERPEAIVDVRVAAIGDGHFVISWVLARADQSSTIYLAEYSLRRGLAPARVVATGRVTDGYQIAWNSNGHGVVAWVTGNDDGSLDRTGHLAFVRASARSVK